MQTRGAVIPAGGRRYREFAAKYRAARRPRRLARRPRRAAPATTLSVNPTLPPPSASAYRGRYPIPINFNDERGQFNTRRESL
jgi:hypothetical protein